MNKIRLILRITLLTVAVLCLAVGFTRKHKVYDADDAFGVVTFSRISERQLVEYSTYGGVYARDGRLVRHDWVGRSSGKQKCPT